ncbi:DUF1236 domain-containing protein [Bradyrhizobium sp. LjRoot220]|uniref:DUF1236 domain-containing protein n=1 Tax=Bradyrhizobium sp. LjRoot220 TaxID=3342284 RepID=UPI003ECF0B9E
MKTCFLLTTAVGVVFATAAFAQSPKDSTTSPTTQTQTPSTPQKAPDTSTSQAPSPNTAPAASGSPSQAQTTPSTSSQPGGTSAPAQAQTNTPAPSSNQAQQTPATGGASNQAQQAPASPPATAQQPSQSTTGQQPSQSTTAQQPAQSTSPPSGTAQSSSTSMNAGVNINDQQRTRVTESISRLNVQPVTNVNFSLSVGTAVPRDIRLQPLPADVVQVVPQYRGYNFFVVRNEIVIVNPSTYQIVTIMPRSGGSTAAAPPARSQSKAAFTDKDRDAVRKHVKTRTERQATGSAAQTTGSASRVVIRRGERLPEAVEVEEFPETVYRDAPALREYRYLHRENRTYLVDPAERIVIEEID